MISGTYNLYADPNWKQLPVQELRLECDTTLAPVIINLFDIAALQGFYNIKLFIVDKTNNAGTNNITINAGGTNTIDGQSNLVLNSNGAATEMQVFSSDQWGSFESIGASGSVPQRIITVDQTFGNDTTAQPYNAAKPYQTVDAAINIAGDGDLIQLNPGVYLAFNNCLQKSLKYSLKAGSNLILFGGGTSSAANESYSFIGEGNLTINSVLNFVGEYNGRTVIDVNVLTFNNFIYFDNPAYFSAPVNGALQFILKANQAINNNPILAIIYPGIVELNVNFGSYTSAITAGTADFWNFGGGTYTFDVNTYIHIGTATMNTTGSPSPFFRVTFGTTKNNTYITGTYNYINSGGAAGRPFFINPDSTVQNIYFNGVAYVTNASMFYDQGSCFCKISGKVFLFDTIGVANGLLTGYLMNSTSKLQIEADTIGDSAVNPILNQASGEIDFVNCQTVNTNPAPGIGTLYKQGGKMRLFNAKVINAVNSIQAPGGAPQPVEVYSCYVNTPTVNIANSLVATAIIVDPAITSNNH